MDVWCLADKERLHVKEDRHVPDTRAHDDGTLNHPSSRA